MSEQAPHMSHIGNPEDLQDIPNAIQGPAMAEDLAHASKFAEADVQLTQDIGMNGQVNQSMGSTGASAEQITRVVPTFNIVPDFEDSLHVDRQGTINIVANAFHEVWLRTRNERTESGAIWANGERDLRLKPTTDREWSERNGSTTVDIANNGFIRLPEDWQAENVAAAEVIVDLVGSLGGVEMIDLDDAEVYKNAAK